MRKCVSELLTSTYFDKWSDGKSRTALESVPQCSCAIVKGKR